jgi:hypothetical protein
MTAHVTPRSDDFQQIGWKYVLIRMQLFPRALGRA